MNSLASPSRPELSSAQLYLCTDVRLKQDDFADFVDAAYSGGVDIIQLRDKQMEAAQELEYLAVLAEAARRHGRLFSANDRADVALLSGADILHLGQKDLPISAARRLLGDQVRLGISTNSLAQARLARTSRVDYFCIGPVWPTPTKPGRAAVGLEVVRAVAAEDDGGLPWFAIGNIGLDTIADVVAAGARRVVVVRAITEATDPAAAAAALKGALPPL